MSVEGARLERGSVRSLYRLEPMQLEDVSAVMDIEQVSFSNPWPKEAFVEEIRKNAFSHPTIACPRASRERIVCGYLIPWVVFDELHIQNVAVHPLHRGRGLGRHLVEEAVELGKRSGCRVALLEVRESNTIARALYVSMGFLEAGKRHKYYSHPQEHAIVYQKNLKDPR
ncbi:MAG TPA: ribosomal protein S18-alanine N-acetyltransferase [Vicinamibacteria bacterium]|jgi:ribosomal-protein-alanine N-acetyltransferase